MLGKDERKKRVGKITDHHCCTKWLYVHIRQVHAVALADKAYLLHSTPSLRISDKPHMIGLRTANSTGIYQLIAKR